jgi:hypothetical protein
MAETLEWRVSTSGLMKEILTNVDKKGQSALRDPILIWVNLLAQVAKRAIELNDLELNKLMIRLGLYSMSDSLDPEYNPELVRKILAQEAPA